MTPVPGSAHAPVTASGLCHPDPVDQEADYDADVRGRVEEVISRWIGSLAGRATVERSEDQECGEPHWAIQPRASDASPVWIYGSSAWVLTVGFGRSSSIELGFSKSVTADAALSDLDEIGRSVIAGRLVEWRRGKRGSRYELTLGDGTVACGYANWFLPLRWRAATEERFSPY